MKKVILICFTFLACFAPLKFVCCQNELGVNHIKLRNVITSWADTLFADEWENGPVLYAELFFRNGSCDTIVLYPHFMDITMIFYYHHKEYRSSMLTSIDSNDSVQVFPKQKVYINSFTWPILGTDFFPRIKHVKGREIIDCSKEIMELIPSVRFEIKLNDEKLITKSLSLKDIKFENYYYFADP